MEPIIETLSAELHVRPEHAQAVVSLLAKSFTAGNHIQEIKGVYVPFWMFDGEAEGDAR